MKKLFLFLALAVLIISCGKKEETQTVPQENQQQLTQQQTQTTEQNKLDESKKDEMKKEDEKKKADEKKKDAEKKESDKKKDDKQTTEKKDKEETSLQKIETSSSDIDFAPIFAKKCAKCHGKDLKGKKDGGPDLTDSKVQNADDAKLIKIITNGVKAKNEDDNDMPAWKNKLSEDEIKAAVKFIKAH